MTAQNHTVHTTKFQITQRHIDAGKPNSCEFCPVTMAIREGLSPNPPTVLVSQYAIIIDGQRFRVPDSIIEFIARCNAELPVEPLEFTLPAESLPPRTYGYRPL